MKRIQPKPILNTIFEMDVVVEENQPKIVQFSSHIYCGKVSIPTPLHPKDFVQRVTITQDLRVSELGNALRECRSVKG